MRSHYTYTYRKFCFRLFAISVWVLLLCLTLNNSSCKKLDIKKINKITTSAIESTDSIITAKSTIVDISDNGITSYGHCWSTEPNPDKYDNKTDFGNRTETGSFSSTLTNLQPNTTYYVRSYLSNEIETIFGKEISFNSSVAAIKITDIIYEILDNSTVMVTSSISGIYSVNVIDYGHQWGPEANKFGNENAFGTLKNTTTYSTTISGLSLETDYVVRAYVQLDKTTFRYSKNQWFYIPDLIVQTNSFTVEDSVNAILQGNIHDIGIYPVTDHGHCWSYTTSSPSINDSILSLGIATKTGTFTTTLENLIPGVDYYYRAYAISENTVRYGIVKEINN